MKNTLIFTFGRFNPPTLGHEKVFKKMQQLRAEFTGCVDCWISISESEGSKENPLSSSERIDLLKGLYKNINVYSYGKTPYDVLKQTVGVWDRMIFVVGEDRFETFKTMKFYAKEWHQEDFSIVNAGKRNNKSRISSISSTKMREAIIDNNFELYKSMVPKAFDDIRINKMWNLLSDRLR